MQRCRWNDFLKHSFAIVIRDHFVWWNLSFWRCWCRRATTWPTAIFQIQSNIRHFKKLGQTFGWQKISSILSHCSFSDSKSSIEMSGRVVIWGHHNSIFLFCAKLFSLHFFPRWSFFSFSFSFLQNFLKISENGSIFWWIEQVGDSNEMHLRVAPCFTDWSFSTISRVCGVNLRPNNTFKLWLLLLAGAKTILLVRYYNSHLPSTE